MPLPQTPQEAGYSLLWTVSLAGLRLISKSNEKAFNRKTGRPYTSQQYLAFERSVAFLAKMTCGQPRLKEGWVVIEPHFLNRVHGDASNHPKSCLDALVKAGVFEDDKYVGVTVPSQPVYGDQNSLIHIWGKKA